MKEVKRYDLMSLSSGTYMAVIEDGEYVLSSDYDDLLNKTAEITACLLEENNALEAERDMLLSIKERVTKYIDWDNGIVCPHGLDQISAALDACDEAMK